MKGEGLKVKGDGCEPKKDEIKILSCKLAELQEKCQLCFQG